MLNWQQEQIQLLFTAPDDAEFFRILSTTAKKLGFDYCAYGLRLPLPITVPKLILFNNYSPQWQQRYIQKNYIAIDPTVSHGLRSIAPFVWSEETYMENRNFWDDARAHGLRAGWAQACHDANGVKGLLNLIRSDNQISLKELESISLQLAWLTQTAHIGLSLLAVPKYLPEASANLTGKEIEVLRWTADGKTSGEIGEILNIAERTVNFHITNTLRKLEAPNKTAAAIKAAVLGFL